MISGNESSVANSADPTSHPIVLGTPRSAATSYQFHESSFVDRAIGLKIDSRGHGFGAMLQDVMGSLEYGVESLRVFSWYTWGAIINP